MRASGFYLAVPCLLALLLLSGSEAAAVEAGARAGRLGATVAYYSAMLATLAIFAAITFAVKQYIWTLYAGLGAVTLIWPALHDQALTQVFVPGLEIPFDRVIAAAFVIAALSFATAAHATARRHPLARLRPVLWACAALSLLAVAVVPLLPDGAAIVLMRSVQLASLLCHVIPVSTFTHLDGEDDRFARNGAIVVALLLAGATVLAVGGAIDFEANRFLFERATVALGVVFGSVLSFRHVIAVSRGREHALEEALAASERDAATSRALLEAERNYSRARELAHRHRDRLAHAAHDVLQPLMSLRRTVDDVTRDGPADLREDVGNAFDYLEEIAARMDPGDAEAAHRQQRPDDHPAATPERVPVQVFLDTLDRMFRAEAEEKGIGFAIAASEAETTADAFAIMRVMSNLLSNAVRHTPSGAVDVRVGREGTSLFLCVENSGQPLSPEDIARLSQAREKGEESTGKGLGLAIAFGIAREQGWELSFEPVPGEVRRNRFTLAVPAAQGKSGLR